MLIASGMVGVIVLFGFIATVILPGVRRTIVYTVFPGIRWGIPVRRVWPWMPQKRRNRMMAWTYMGGFGIVATFSDLLPTVRKVISNVLY